MHKSIQNHHLVVGFITFRFLHGIRTAFGTVFRTVFGKSKFSSSLIKSPPHHQHSLSRGFYRKSLKFTPVLGSQIGYFSPRKRVWKSFETFNCCVFKIPLERLFPAPPPKTSEIASCRIEDSVKWEESSFKSFPILDSASTLHHEICRISTSGGHWLTPHYRL